MGCSTVFVCARGVYTRSETNKLYRDIIEIKEIERGTPVSICYMQSLCVAESIDMTTGFSMNRHRQQQRRNKKAKRRKERSISAAFWVTWPMHGAPALPAGFFFCWCSLLFSRLSFLFYFFFFPAHHRVQAMSRAFIYLSIYAEEDAAAAALRSTMFSLWPTSRSGNQQFSV